MQDLHLRKTLHAGSGMVTESSAQLLVRTLSSSLGNGHSHAASRLLMFPVTRETLQSSSAAWSCKDRAGSCNDPHRRTKGRQPQRTSSVSRWLWISSAFMASTSEVPWLPCITACACAGL